MKPQSAAASPFSKVLEALLDENQILDPRYLYRLSDLEKDEAAALSAAWPKIPLWRRQALLEDIEQIGLDDMLLNFVALCRIAFQDEDARVRLLAVQIVDEYEETDLIPALMLLLENDAVPEVRAAAASGLGNYIYLGEIEELPKKTLRQMENLLLTVVQSKDALPVRCAALESLGHSSRAEIPALIERAYAAPQKDWLVSALMAMGRSGNSDWEPQVIEMLHHDLPEVRCEAVRAAGALELQAATPILIALLDDPDKYTRAASIWSLSQIGGEGVSEALELLAEEAEDDDEIALLDEALENLSFNETMPYLQGFEFSASDEEDAEEGFEDLPDLFLEAEEDDDEEQED